MCWARVRVFACMDVCVCVCVCVCTALKPVSRARTYVGGSMLGVSATLENVCAGALVRVCGCVLCMCACVCVCIHTHMHTYISGAVPRASVTLRDYTACTDGHS